MFPRSVSEQLPAVRPALNLDRLIGVEMDLVFALCLEVTEEGRLPAAEV